MATQMLLTPRPNTMLNRYPKTTRTTHMVVSAITEVKVASPPALSAEGVRNPMFHIKHIAVQYPSIIGLVSAKASGDGLYAAIIQSIKGSRISEKTMDMMDEIMINLSRYFLAVSKWPPPMHCPHNKHNLGKCQTKHTIEIGERISYGIGGNAGGSHGNNKYLANQSSAIEEKVF